VTHLLRIRSRVIPPELVPSARRVAIVNHVSQAAAVDPGWPARRVGQVVRWDIAIERQVVAVRCDKTVLFLSFPYVCPEPVLVKLSFLHINGEKRPFCHLFSAWSDTRLRETPPFVSVHVSHVHPETVLSCLVLSWRFK
jgi:hypothetical protein